MQAFGSAWSASIWAPGIYRTSCAGPRAARPGSAGWASIEAVAHAWFIWLSAWRSGCGGSGGLGSRRRARPREEMERRDARPESARQNRRRSVQKPGSGAPDAEAGGCRRFQGSASGVLSLRGFANACRPMGSVWRWLSAAPQDGRARTTAPRGRPGEGRSTAMLLLGRCTEHVCEQR